MPKSDLSKKLKKIENAYKKFYAKISLLKMKQAKAVSDMINKVEKEKIKNIKANLLK